MLSTEKSYRAINFAVDLLVIWMLVAVFDLVTDQKFIGISFLVIYFFYYFIFEITVQKTLGKMATNTTVVDMNGKKPGLRAIVIRSICRLLHIDMMTFLVGAYGLHDGYSKTKVVRDQK